MNSLTAIVLTALCAPPLDEEAAPFDYIRPAKGNKYVFVMLSPGANKRAAYGYRQYADSSSYQRKDQVGPLYGKYKFSGLYRNDGSTKPLWTVDWYSFDVRACSDGVHLVRFGPWPRKRDNGTTLAVAFYKSGKAIKSYSVRDLVPNHDNLPQSISHYQWMKSNSFDDAGKRLKVDLLTRPALMFDLRTGGKQVVRLTGRRGATGQ